MKLIILVATSPVGLKTKQLMVPTSPKRQQTEKKKQVHKVLSEVYGWFHEGFAALDLQEVKILLEKLV